MFDWVKLIRKKDKQSVALLYNKYGKKLYSYAITRWNLSQDESWDLVYKTLYRLIEVIDLYKFENEVKLEGFLFTIFTNYLRNYYRDTVSKRGEEVSLDENGDFVSLDSEQEDEAGKNIQLLKEELEKLEDWQRVLLLMRAQNYTYEQIAEFVKRPADQLKVYYIRLKKQLSAKLEGKMEMNGRE